MTVDETTPVDIWYRIGNIDKRIIWWTVSILLAIVLLNPIGLPIETSATSREFYGVMQTLPQGSVVLMEISTTAYAWDEIGPGAIAVAKMLRSQGQKLIIVGTHVPDSGILSELVFEKAGWKREATYGEDYVNLGFVSGSETTVFTMARDFQFVEKDIDGTPLSEISLTKDINDANDIDMVIDIHSAGAVDTFYIRHWVTQYGTKFLDVVTSASIHGVVPYYESGDALAYLGGIKGVAEFEFLSGFPGEAIKSLDAQSVFHVIFFIIVLLGNLALLSERRKQ
jgi:hypothetical protein